MDRETTGLTDVVAMNMNSQTTSLDEASEYAARNLKACEARKVIYQ